MKQPKLGLAGNLARMFINSPLSPLLLFASLALGIMGLILTPRQEDPQISVPMVDIFFSYHGASANQVASLATDPLERLMSEIQGVDHVYSVSNRDGAMVTVQFDVGEELGPSLVKLNDKIQSNLDRIPPGVSQPLIRPKGVDDVPVVTLTLWSHELDEAGLRSLGLDVLQRLKEIDTTSQSFITGGRSDAIRVEIFPERLAGFGIGLDQIAQTISSANAERSVGTVEMGQTTFSLQTGAFLKNASDIENLMIGTQDGQVIYIRDVALVTESTDDANNLVSYYTGPAYGAHEGQDEVIDRAPIGASAITISVAKKSGTNGVSVANDVLAYVDRLKGSLIPDNVHVEVTRNYGETANEKVNELIFKLFVVTGAVTLLIWLALGMRAATVVLIVIPVVILLTVFCAWLLGYTIDRVSLFALIFSIGILVDDAIVVVENIYRRWLLNGECSDDCSVDAVREVGNPTILATFTVISALLPMGFVTGMMGPYMGPIPALGSVAMLLSLFAAFIFTPWLAQRIKPSMKKLAKMQESEHRQSERLHHFFEHMLYPLLDSPAKARLFRLGMWLVFFLSLALFYTQTVTVKMLPNDNKPEFNVVVNMPEGTALPVTANAVTRLSDELLKMPEVVALQSYTGTASPFNFNGLVRHTYLRDFAWGADIQVQLTDKGDRDRTSHDLAVAARAALKPLADQLGARIEVVEMPPGPPVLQTMVAEIYGPDDATRRQVARDVERLFDQAENIVDADSYLQMPFDSWRFVIDREKASRLGVSVETINRQLEMTLGGYRLGDVKDEHALEPRFIYLHMPLALRGEFGRLGQLPVPSASGVMIPLTTLGHFEQYRVDDPVYHKDLRAVEYVTGEVAGRLGAPIYGILEMENLLDDYTAPDGVRVDTNYIGPPTTSLQSALEWGGEWTVTYVTFRDMGIAFGVALIMIYILVVGEFGNFRLPAIIMAPIPLTLIGIVPGHWLFGAPFTATSMIGFIALAGIIVRNSILLVDFSRQAVAEGMPVKDAVIHACATRTRPIIITALALMIGSSVILSDPIFEGMAISLMMGGMVSTLLTLVVIPLGCVKYADAMQELGHEQTANGAPMPPAEPAPKPLHVSDSNGKGVIGTTKSALAGLWDAVLFVGAALFGLARGLGRMVIGTRTKPATPKSAPTPATVVSTPLQEPVKPEAKPAKPKSAKPAAKPKAAKPATARKAAITAKPAAKPKAAKPKAAKPASKPAASKPKTKSATRKAATKPASKPATRRKAKPSGRRGIQLKTPNSDNQE
ncbi:efflux RND transporter permease subunit [Profundibacter sp.]|uniref:efflux RND transporter permease subunit n=1 Tax=Profundibacter sp. TaxID=3101071 RepID=UPI003D0B6BE6